MPIGTSKAGLFGGVGIEAGCQTFNAPGTFTVPAALSVVSINGNGSTANPGNPGNPGGDGAGGNGGPGGPIPAQYPTCPNQGGSGGSKTGGTGGAGNPPGGPGNPGNPGGCTTVFGYSFTGGVAGNGGTGGTNGVVGGNGTTGYVSPFSSCSGSTQTAPGGTGPQVSGGFGAAGSKTYSRSPDCDPIQIINEQSLEGGGGGGGAVPPSQFGSPGTQYNPGSSGQSPTFGSGGIGARRYPVGPQSPVTPSPASPGQPGGTTCQGGAGAGGGGGGLYVQNCPSVNRPAIVAGGGGGGGGGTVGNPGSGAGNPGNPGNPGSFNCVPVSAGCFPVQVGTGGQINISWNDQ